MNISNTEKLIKAAPTLFADMDSDGYGYVLPIHFGFECGDGWFELLHEACVKIHKRLQKMSPKHRDAMKAIQVKEKYGTLRFYISYHDDKIEEIISDAVKKSAVTCEVCGASGKLRGSVWFYTACDEHTREADKNVNLDDLP